MRIAFLAAAVLAFAAPFAPSGASEGPLVERWAFSGSTLDELRASADYPGNPA